MVFPVVLNYKERWVLKNWCFWAVVLEKTLENPLDCKEIKPVNPKGNQSWIFIGRIDAEAETLNTLATWCEEPTHWKRSWCWERLRVGGERDDRGWDVWMASLADGHEFEQAPAVGDRQGSLANSSPWGHKESDKTEQLNRTEAKEQSWPGREKTGNYFVLMEKTREGNGNPVQYSCLENPMDSGAW